MNFRNATWIIADTHFGHKNIVAFQQRPESHEAIMLSEWIWRVRETDPILHLGDVFMGKGGSAARWAAIISRLPGRKFLILGNHDRCKPGLYEQAGFTIVPEFITHDGFAVTHRPVSLEHPGPPGEWHTNVHGHVHANEYRPEHDGTPLEGKRYVNVSVEVTNFAPQQFGNVKSRARA